MHAENSMHYTSHNMQEYNNQKDHENDQTQDNKPSQVLNVFRGRLTI